MRQKAKNTSANHSVPQPASPTQPLITNDLALKPVCDIGEPHIVHLSARDSVRVLEVLENPPEPNGAALEAARMFMKSHG
jgi:hypothetical protein